MSSPSTSAPSQILISGRLYRLTSGTDGELEIGRNKYPFAVVSTPEGPTLQLENARGEEIAIRPKDTAIPFGRGTRVDGVQLIDDIPSNGTVSRVQLSVRMSDDGEIDLRNVGNASVRLTGGPAADVTSSYEKPVAGFGTSTRLTVGEHFMLRPNNKGGVVAEITFPGDRRIAITQDPPLEGNSGLLRVRPVGAPDDVAGKIVTAGWQGINFSEGGLEYRGDSGADLGMYSWQDWFDASQPHAGLELISDFSNVDIKVGEAMLTKLDLGSRTIELGAGEGTLL